MTSTAAQTATERAELLEERIRATRSKRAELARAAPVVSSRDVALANLGEGSAKVPTAADLAHHDDELRFLDLDIDGLLELRIELEEAVIAEKIAAIDASTKAVRARQAPILAALEEARLEQERKAREADRFKHELARFQEQRTRLDVALRQRARGESSAHFLELCDRLGAPLALLRGRTEDDK